MTCAFGPWQLLHAQIDRAGVVQPFRCRVAHDAGGELDVGFVLHLSIWADYMCVVVNFFLGSPLFLPSKYNRSLIFNLQLQFRTLGAIQLSTPSKSGTSGGFPFCGSLKIPI